MNSDLISSTTEGHPCHSCLMHSSNPEKCTHCGAPIESVDINAATFKPPEYGTYFTPTLYYSDELVLRSAKASEKEFYQNYKIIKQCDGHQISSNEIAYQVFAKKLGEESGTDISDVMEKIPFFPMRGEDTSHSENSDAAPGDSPVDNVTARDISALRLR